MKQFIKDFSDNYTHALVKKINTYLSENEGLRIVSISHASVLEKPDWLGNQHTNHTALVVFESTEPDS